MEIDCEEQKAPKMTVQLIENSSDHQEESVVLEGPYPETMQ
jgi:hypothetical protein